jgi:hypothetical protein
MQQEGGQLFGGYPCGMFFAPPPDDLKCSICTEVLQDPLQVCSRVQHTYCRACITRWKASPNDTCPLCRAPSSREDPDSEKRIRILQLQVRCPHGGSNSSGSGSGQANSTSSSSNIVDTRAGRQQKKRKQDHGTSPSMPATSCEWMGQLGEYEAHVAACPFVEVPCPFSEAGCGFRAARRDMAAHSGDMGAHFLMTMTTVAAVRAESAADKGRIAALEADRSSLQRYVSILDTSGEAEAAGVMEWMSSLTVRVHDHNNDDDYEFTYTGQMRG